jgi:hypothetical protein
MNEKRAVECQLSSRSFPGISTNSLSLFTRPWVLLPAWQDGQGEATRKIGSKRFLFASIRVHSWLKAAPVRPVPALYTYQGKLGYAFLATSGHRLVTSKPHSPRAV